MVLKRESERLSSALSRSAPPALLCSTPLRPPRPLTPRPPHSACSSDAGFRRTQAPLNVRSSPQGWWRRWWWKQRAPSPRAAEEAPRSPCASDLPPSKSVLSSAGLRVARAPLTSARLLASVHQGFASFFLINFLAVLARVARNPRALTVCDH